MECVLADLVPGDVGQIIGFAPGDSRYRHQLLSMGLTPGTSFTLIRRAPLGDPVQIRVRDTLISLRQREAKLLKIERVTA